jgi:glycosyltransferase involved in cell wall biosynthesis
MKKLAIVYSTNPARGIQGMDTIRWAAMGHRFRWLQYKVKLITDRRRGLDRFDRLHLASSRKVNWSEFDVVKTCYQASIDLVEPHPLIVSRMCRVVDEHLPARDDGRREEMMRQQRKISEMASIVAFNDRVNADRWREIYGDRQQILLTPTGCPENIPAAPENPFPADRKIVLFSGSLTSHRFPQTLNALARRLCAERSDVEVHFLGRNRLEHYAGDSEPLDPEFVRVHEPVDEVETWRFVLHASVGLALAPSEHEFESELSKIYYYLRAGLPVVTESSVPNRSVIEECGHGRIAAYDDIDDLTAKTLAALELESRCESVMQHMVDVHSWRRRAEIYDAALKQRWQCKAS